jgi:tRNA pseudouridine55 synthase
MTLEGVRMNSIESFRSSSGGGLLVDKPLTWTSFDVVKKVRFALRVKKVGHAGTLDPLATGLLVLMSNDCTKLIDRVQAERKVYEGSCILGGMTDSYDAASPVRDPKPYDHCTRQAIESAMENFTGWIEQVPPMFSAVKHEGQRLYTLARKGQEVARAARRVQVETFELLAMELPVLHFRVVCSKGTYVRALVHDLGQQLQCGAYLASLRRTAIGSYSVENALTIEQLVQENTDRSGGA